MTGPEHYQVAEKILENIDTDAAAANVKQLRLLEAIAHATLANAAASTLSQVADLSGVSRHEWYEVTHPSSYLNTKRGSDD